MTNVRVSVVQLAAIALAMLAVACTPPDGKKQKGAVCAATAECSDGLECREGICNEAVELLCEPGAKHCAVDAPDNVMKCADDGASETLETQCAAGCNAGVCNPSNICVPGELACDPDGVTRLQCDQDGGHYNAVDICSIGCDSVTQGCKVEVCLPGARRCVASSEGKSIETCATDGSGWTKADCATTAGAGSRCVPNGITGVGESAFCVRNACEPGKQRCDGADVIQCQASGTTELYLRSCEFGCTGDGECATATCKPEETTCSTDGKSVVRCNSLGTAKETISCNTNGVGSCVLTGSGGFNNAKCVRQICTPSAVACRNDVRFECNANGLEDKVIENCAFGCAADGVTCAVPACTVNELKCSGNDLVRCAPDRRSFRFDQFCSAGCVADATTGARCGFALCAPLTSRCTAPSASLPTGCKLPGQSCVERCSATGRSYDAPVACAAGQNCEDGGCRATDATCNDGATRCAAGDLEKCATVAGKLGYQKRGACLASCGTGSTDACDSAGECGPFTIRPVGIAAGTALPGDGQSTFLIVSDPLVGPNGGVVPDGTLVTLATEPTGAQPSFASGDASDTLPGLQVRVVGGRIDFLVRAPTLTSGTPETATIRGLVADKAACATTLVMTFDSSVVDMYMGEDFSTTRAREGNGAFSGWDTKLGVLTLNAFDAGDGRDGDLIVSSGTVDIGQPRNGATYADLYSTRVRSIEGKLVTFEGAAAPFTAPGTRVLLINVHGSPGATSEVGNYEFATIEGIEAGQIELTQPVSKVYGPGGNSAAALTNQMVRIIRVPQYNRVLVDGTGVLTASAYDGTSGGILAFYASSSRTRGGAGSGLRATGRISMSQRGLRGATAPAQDVAPNAANEAAGAGAGFGLNACVAGSRNVGGGTSDALDGTRDLATGSGGLAAAGSGRWCGASNKMGDIVPGGTNATSTFANAAINVYYGSSGSHAGVGASPYCASYGPSPAYGDVLLTKAFMGGGTGTIHRSHADSCAAVQNNCCRRVDGSNTCCAFPGGNVNNSGSAASPSGGTECLNCVAAPYCKQATYIWDQSFAGATGGGMIFINAADFEVQGSTAQIESNGANVIDPNVRGFGTSASTGYGSAGGTISIRAGALTLGSQGRILATGGDGASAGRIRIDAVSTDAAFNASSWTTPGAAYFTLSSDVVRSTVQLTITTPATHQFLTGTAIVLPGTGAVSQDAAGTFDFATNYNNSLVALRLSADNGNTFGALDATGKITFGGTNPAPRGKQAKWQLTAANNSPIGSTRGFQAKFTRGP